MASERHIYTREARSTRSEPLTVAVGPFCEHCGRPYTPNDPPRGEPRRFCSDSCRVAAWWTARLGKQVLR